MTALVLFLAGLMLALSFNLLLKKRSTVSATTSNFVKSDKIHKIAIIASGSVLIIFSTLSYYFSLFNNFELVQIFTLSSVFFWTLLLRFAYKLKY